MLKFSDYVKAKNLSYGKPKQDAYLINKKTPNFSNWKNIKFPDHPNTDETKKEIKKIDRYLKTNTKEDWNKIYEQDIPDIELLFVKLLESKGEKIDHDLKNKIVSLSKQLSTISLYYKIKYNRPRPFQFFEILGQKLKFKGNTTDSPSYPSTHALIGTFISIYLSKIFAKHKSDLIALGKELGDYRVKAGFHFQSDCDAGNWLANKLFEYFKED